jgi:methylaspartate mutase sigma subunit
VLSTINGHGVIEAPDYVAQIRADPALAHVRVVIGGNLSINGKLDLDEVSRLHSCRFDGVFTSSVSLDEFDAFLGALDGNPTGVTAWTGVTA